MITKNSIYKNIDDIHFKDIKCHFENFLDGETGIDCSLVHKAKEENVLVSAVKLIDSNDNYDEVISRYILDIKHSFFFEHPKDHIPGLMLIEAGRQAGTLMSHVIYNVPLDHIFILDDIQVKFLNLANLESPIIAYNHIKDKKFKKNTLISLIAEGYFFQDEKKIASIKSTWRIINPRIFKRMSRK
ncbi:AfsA-related hotdog domain-containing protein [Zobellia nedashkovskayae]|uniref:AfsA-related hotdog domain-containing protein n=1 Tax=Zobellia nedashkovskayae TaxID=2779510 RepID=UPI00188DAFB2|nr:AfsA-related hotdog domain-containing protein [Zobellia nedashkovskayae]